MKRDVIFLSYRRGDSPGYVSRLEDELERQFGSGRVFRDATDIPGGASWKSVIEDNLRASAVLLLIIGPRWEQIWHDRKGEEVNYVALELELARNLKVPIIPVTLDGTQLSRELDLGSLAWILDNQIHDISDRQGRWAGDFGRLVKLLEKMDGVGPVRSDDSPSNDKSKTSFMGPLKWVVAGVVLAVGGLTWLSLNFGQPSEPEIAVEQDPAATLPNTSPVATTLAQPSPDARTAARPSPNVRAVAQPPQTVDYPVPDIAGLWQGQDGTLYYIDQLADGTVTINSPGYASGRGHFIPNMPRKLSFVLDGVGHGESSVSHDDRTMMGWIMVNGQQEYDKLVRIE